MKTIEDFESITRMKEGKTKKLYTTPSHEGLLMEFKDDLTAGNGEMHDLMEGKGEINARISARLMEYLENQGVKTHFMEFIKPRHHLVKELDMIPLECVGRNLAYGSLTSRVPLFEEGKRIEPPVVEFFYKSDALGDPFLNLSHIVSLNILNQEEAGKIQKITGEVGKLLKTFFEDRNLLLVDFKLEFGLDANGELRVGDEINGDSMRIWDQQLWEEKQEIRMLDKQVYREGSPLKEVRATYEELCEKVCGETF